MAEGLEVLAKFAVIVNLSVENDPDVLVFIAERLMATLHINDAQPSHPQGQPRGASIIHEEAVFIRPAMAHGRSHGPHVSISQRTRGSVG